MTRGLSRRQVGVTKEMIESYGDCVWELSTNVQIRRGDPVRLLEWDRTEAQRPDTGLSDQEIADWTGLTRDQVLYIRLAMERRRYRRNNYHRLFDLGGGKRFRNERFVAHEDRFAFSDDAMALRAALRFDPGLSARWLRQGQWNGDTVARRFAARARQRPDGGLAVASNGSLTNGAAYDAAQRLANAFLSLGLRRGDVVAVRLPDGPAFLLTYFAVALMGGVFCPLDDANTVAKVESLIGAARARALICDFPEFVDCVDRLPALNHVIIAERAAPPGALSWEILAEGGQPGGFEEFPVASDPAVLFASPSGAASPRWFLHTYQTLLSNARALVSLYDLRGADLVMIAAPLCRPAGFAALNMALQAGAAVRLLPDKSADSIAQALAGSRPTALVAEPDQLDVAALAGWDLGSVRRAGLAGPDWDGAHIQALRAAMPNGAVAPCWAAPECLMALHHPFDTPGEARRGTLGRPLEGAEVRAVGDAGTALAAGAAGMFEIRGPTVGVPASGADEAMRESGWRRLDLRASVDEAGDVRPSY